MESRTQGSRPRPRTQKKFRGQVQGQTLSRPRPRTQAYVFSKKSLQIFFSGDSKKKTGLKNFFSGEKVVQKTFFRRSPLEEDKKGLRKFSARFLVYSNEISTFQKIVLPSSRGQGNFRGLEASRPRPRTSKCVFEDSARTPPLIKTSLVKKSSQESG